MKKRILAVITAILMIIPSTAFAAYQTGTTVDELILSGETTPYKRVTLIVLNSDNMECDNAEETFEKYQNNVKNNITMTTSEIFSFGSVVADSEGKWSYKMDMTGLDISGNNMEADDYTANYTVISNVNDPEYVVYGSIAYRKGIIPTLKEKAAIDDNYASLTETITQAIDFITDGKMYKKLSDKKSVAKLNKETFVNIDVNSDDAVGIVKKGIDEAVLIESVIEGIETDFDNVISIAEYSFDEDALTDKGKEKTVENIKEHDAYENIADYKEFVVEQINIQLLNNNTNKTGSNLAEVLVDVSDVLDLDLTKFDKLSESDKAYVARQLSNSNCVTAEDMQKKLNSIISSIKESDKKGGGSGSGSSGGSSSVANIGTGVSHEYLQQHKYTYPDMNLAPWSADAINYLIEKGIINGYTDGTFRPLNSITRAEFIKIMTEAFYYGEQAEYVNTFSDVKENDWYSKYITIAYNKGIVSGAGNGKFNPDAPITRQDMAVIIYNAATKAGLFEKSEITNLFSDDSSIADYAKDAVYSLKNQSIINGVGENMFAPLNNADRASAAQIIYSLMSKFDN